jgi:hypothetical protein
MFSGFTSRWITPLRCADSSALATSQVMRTASLIGRCLFCVEPPAKRAAFDVRHHIKHDPVQPHPSHAARGYAGVEVGQWSLSP